MRYAEAEARRVAEIIGRDRADREADERRERARKQVLCGEFANIADTVLGPTPEQLATGEFVPFTPDKEQGTARSVSTVRRVVTAIPFRLLREGKISDEQHGSCVWYRGVHDATGLVGSIPSTDFGREVFSPPTQRFPFTEAQLIAQEAYRFVKTQLPPRMVPFFEAVVLGDRGLRPAAARTGMPRRRMLSIFRDLADRVTELRKAIESND